MRNLTMLLVIFVTTVSAETIQIPFKVNLEDGLTQSWGLIETEDGKIKRIDFRIYNVYTDQEVCPYWIVIDVENKTYRYEGGFLLDLKWKRQGRRDRRTTLNSITKVALDSSSMKSSIAVYKNSSRGCKLKVDKKIVEHFRKYSDVVQGIAKTILSLDPVLIKKLTIAYTKLGEINRQTYKKYRSFANIQSALIEAYHDVEDQNLDEWLFKMNKEIWIYTAFYNDYFILNPNWKRYQLSQTDYLTEGLIPDYENQDFVYEIKKLVSSDGRYGFQSIQNHVERLDILISEAKSLLKARRQFLEKDGYNRLLQRISKQEHLTKEISELNKTRKSFVDALSDVAIKLQAIYGEEEQKLISEASRPKLEHIKATRDNTEVEVLEIYH